jgi:hypothetical protein
MTVYLAYTDADFDVATPGPWSAVHRAGPGLTLLESEETLSRVYHELKWSLPGGAALFVAALVELPKLSRCAPGTTSWLRDRLRSRDVRGRGERGG